MADKQKPHEDVLTRLVRGLETKKTLCHVKDYPGVELKELNLRVKKLGPLVNPVFGEQPAFFIDEGRFIPYRIVVYDQLRSCAPISAATFSLPKCSGEGGRATTSQGAFIFGIDVECLMSRTRLAIPTEDCRLSQRGRIVASPLSPPLLLRLKSSLVEALNAALSIERCEMNISSTASSWVG
ncbi:hypothetical protein PC129_g20840 [Phytophthora cactorum]|uniref:Uncharacterized protein n=1 Tax=Phytophthora cactorum TaxID=29920 RepID=A0A329S5P8_9STRA|nr:hypothetical protein Pcac1_g5062 [Phytophthora cactorum]KAG2798381.1 hypothetical protein PC111_g20879 [Phytophthora cactorum]KAG2804408.1 hypothetical protein PC112_g18735 [Phytophthora cactorum]KAG2876951.1 hypothetical protein PC114_g23911 [Phytophthora cactorum]KAG2884359.1 hypothetical protein PC115_g21358 [Phytophthora cactorum]